MTFPADISCRIVEAFGNDAGVWLETAPALAEELVEEWNLQPEATVWGNYSFVIPAGDFVLKLLPPSEELDRQIAALLAWHGNGVARLENFDIERGAMLIERARPGIELTGLFHEGRDEEATAITCELMPRLAVETDYPFPTAADRAADLARLRKRFNGKTGPFPEHLVDAAENLFTELIASQGEQVLIHGDLHHENILSAQREPWLAIDPHGLIAEREFETYALLLNPDGIAKNPDLKAISRRRIDQMSDHLGFDPERIRGWGIACAVLSAWWSFDGHGSGYEDALAIAEALLAV
jgi:streptomycin 6-kinase